jgi:hypothetical protein
MASNYMDHSAISHNDDQFVQNTNGLISPQRYTVQLFFIFLLDICVCKFGVIPIANFGPFT